MKSVMIKKWYVALAFAFLCFLFCTCVNDNVLPQPTQQQLRLEAGQQDQQMLRRELIFDGVITGPDARLCPSPCCGGWIVMIDSAFYTFSSLPDFSMIDLANESFPLKVKLLWAPDTALKCNHIFVRWIKVDDSVLPVPMSVQTSTPPEATKLLFTKQPPSAR